MAITVHWMEQGSPEWHAAREDMYTGSNAYKLLGNIDYLDYAKAKQTEFKGNFWTRRGHLLEDEAIELYESIRNVKVERPGFITNDEFPGCLYSPDGWPPLILPEVKCFSLERHMELVRGDIPLKILAQIHYGLTLSKRSLAHLIAYNPKAPRLEDKFKIIPIRRNKAIVDNFRRRLPMKGDSDGGIHSTQHKEHRIAAASR